MDIRQAVALSEEILTEGDVPSRYPTTRGAAAVVIRNPWLGQRPESLLSEEVAALAPGIALLLSRYLIDILGGVENITSFGKGAIVGLNGEREHGAAFQHTAYFGNVLRERLDATQIINSADVRGPAGTLLSVPMGHKTLGGRRDFFESMPVWIDLAPEPDEIAIIAVGATGPRPHARIGDRTTDPAVTLADYATHPLCLTQEN